MTSRFFAIGTLGVLAAISAGSAVGPPQPVLRRPNTPGLSLLHASGSRSLEQRASAAGSKFDASLAQISRHWNQARRGRSIGDMQSINPAARFVQPADAATPLVLVDAVTTGDVQQLKAALVELGLQHAAVYSNDVSGWLPVSALDAATQRTELHSIRAAMSRAHAGAVTTQGDFAQHSDSVRSANALTGAGVTVGVLSDSFNCYAQFAANGVPAGGNAGYANNGFNTTAEMDMTSGDLSSTVNVLEETTCMSGGHYIGYPLELPPGDEGRAMLQIVHDVAPGASLAFHTANEGEADFAAGITQLAAAVGSGGAGAKIIADDVGYFDEPFYQDGIVAQAINQVAAQGVAYFTSAGNNGTLAYNNNAPVFTTVSASGSNVGEKLLNFDTTNTTNTIKLPVTVPPMIPGEFVAIVVQWDQPYVTGAAGSGGSKNQIDVCLTDVTGDDDVTDDNLNPITGNCSGPNAVGTDPVQVILVGIPANAAGNSDTATFNIEVGLKSGTAPGRIKVSVEGDGLQLTINQFATNSGTVQGHSSAAGAASVGAAFFANTPACGTTPATLEFFSSSGGDPILFDVNGTRLTTPVIRQKPDFVGPDGGNDTFLGFTLANGGPDDNSTVAGCLNNANFPNFFGTSASTPHVGAIAALFLQANPALTPSEIISAMQTTALPMGGTTPNFNSGFGFVQANLAADTLPPAAPPAPSLTLGAASVAVNTSTTLSWSSANTTGCTASGSWSGAVATSGSESVTPTAVGTDTYTLTCVNNAGTSPPTSAVLTVTAAASSGSHGGGALEIWSLLGLASLLLARLRLSPRR
jgi:Subtilase family